MFFRYRDQQTIHSIHSTLRNVSGCHSRIMLTVFHLALSKAAAFEHMERTDEAEDGGILAHNKFRNSDSGDLRRYVDCARGSAHEGTEASGLSRILRKYLGCWKGYWPRRLPCTRHAPV